MTPQPSSAGQLPPVDWTTVGDELASATKPLKGPEVRSIAGYRETTRGALARWLMLLLTLVVLAVIALAALLMAGVISAKSLSLQSFAQVALTPIVTLTGTALGFYFGAQSVAGGDEGSGLPPTREPGWLRRFARWIW